LEIENLIDRAEKLKEKSSYLQSLKLFKKAFQGYAKIGDPEDMLHCMLSLGDIYRMLGNFDHAAKNYSEAIKLARKHRETIWVADASVGLGLSLRAQGKWKDALKLIRASRRTYQGRGDREGFAFSLWAEAGTLRIKGRISEAIKIFGDSRKLFKNLENRQGIGFCLCGLGGTSRVAGLFSDSLKYYTAANRLFSHIEDVFGTAYSYCGIGNAYRMMRDYKSALASFAKAIRLYKKIGDRVSYAYTLWSLGTTHKMMENFKEARDNFIKAMLLFKKTRDPRGIIYCRLGLGELDFLEGREAIAMRQLNSALFESIKNSFAIEKCHAKTILSYINKNNPPPPHFSKGEQGGFSEKIDDRCYNRLGLKLKFQGLPFNIP
jgi:tetratricopeptide (TPR) repeat protein